MPRDYSAKLVIWDHDKMTKKERRRLLSWLRSQINLLTEEGENIAKRYTARLINVE